VCVCGEGNVFCALAVCVFGWIHLIVLSVFLASSHNPTVHLYLPQLHFSFSSFTNPVFAFLFLLLNFSFHLPNKQTNVWLTFLTDWRSGSWFKFSLNPACHKQHSVRHSILYDRMLLHILHLKGSYNAISKLIWFFRVWMKIL